MLIFVPSVLFGKVDVPFPQREATPEKYFASQNHPLGLGFHKAWSTKMHSLHLHTFARWFFQFESYGPAILVTIGAALLMACGIGAACSPCKEKDEVFHRQVF
jgi:hypothetical protein